MQTTSGLVIRSARKLDGTAASKPTMPIAIIGNAKRVSGVDKTSVASEPNQKPTSDSVEAERPRVCPAKTIRATSATIPSAATPITSSHIGLIAGTGPCSYGVENDHLRLAAAFSARNQTE